MVPPEMLCHWNQPRYTGGMSASPDKTFYLETFGCQMNAHDSEKVVGTLLHEGYRQVETVERLGWFCITPVRSR